jgi:hypothetical protein
VFRKRILLFASLAAATPALAVEGDKLVPVVVQADCDGNNLGQRFIYNIKEKFRASTRFKVATDYKDSVIQLQLVCLNPSPDEDGVIIRYAYAVTTTHVQGFYDYLVTFGVGSCGSAKLESCAESRVAGVDADVDDIVKRIEDGTFETKPK